MAMFKLPAKSRFLFLGVCLVSGWLCAAPSQLFADTLPEAMVAAYQNNPQLMAERARLRETDETYAQAQAQGRFTASGSASLGGTATFSKSEFDFGTGSPIRVSSDDSFIPHSFAVSGQLPLYTGGRIRSLKSQAEYGILAARDNLRNAEQAVLLSVATAYANVLRDEEVARIRRNNVSVLTRQVEAANARFNVGAGTRTDIAQADSRLAAANAGLASADAQLAVSRAAFIRGAGFIPSQLAPVPRYLLPDTREAAEQMVLTYNPQLEAARYAEIASQYGIDVASAAHKPTLSLQGFTQVQRDASASTLEADAIGASINLTIPLVTGGANKSSLRSAQAAKTRSRFETRSLEDGAREQVAVLWAQLDAARRTLQASSQQVRAAEIAFEGVGVEQEVGTRTALDVLDAEQEVLNAKLSIIQAQNQIDILTFQMLALGGAFDAQSLELPVELYDAAQNLSAISEYDFFGPVLDPLKQAFGQN